MRLPSGSVVKNPLAMQEILGLERSPGVGKGNPLQYSCLENAMDTGARGLHPWVTQSGTQDTSGQLSACTVLSERPGGVHDLPSPPDKV